MALSYDWGYATPQLNGNIAGMQWRSRGDGEKRSYGFGYDRENRLLYADFAQGGSSGWADPANINFDMQMGTGTADGSAYDENGNIRAMKQWGLTYGSSGPQSPVIDDLVYTYTQNGLTNKLQNVVDAQNQPLTKLGDFRSSQAYMTALGGTKTAAAVDYTYDDNGNLKRDLNKDIGTATADGITYNHLNLPWKVTVQNKGYIQYLYDAAGNKLQKIVKETGKPDKVTDYLGGTVYENDVLQYIGHEEGRMRLATQTTINGCGASGSQWLAFDYMLKDHLGNVRATLTDEWQQDNYPAATMEDATIATEDAFYTKLYTTRSSPLPSNYPAASASNQWAAKLNKNGAPVGPGILLKVMAGDRINLQCDMWYRTNSTTPDNSGSNVLAPLLLQLAGGIPGVSGGHLETGQTGNAGSFFTPSVSGFLGNQPAAGSVPQAGVSWLLLDEQFGWQAGNGSGIEPVGDNEQYKHYVKGCGDAVEVQKSGYIYVYTSNQSNIDVFFDNLQVSMVHGPLLEETQYYPFGMQMAGISTKAAGKLDNKKKYNGIEFNNDLDLDTYEAFYRNLDPQTGRWWQIDPKIENDQENGSPYVAMANDPILKSDPLGDVPSDGDAISIGGAIITGLEALGTVAEVATPLGLAVAGVAILAQYGIDHPEARVSLGESSVPYSAQLQTATYHKTLQTQQPAQPVPSSIAKNGARVLMSAKKRPKDLVQEAKEQQAKEAAAKARTEKREAASKDGANKPGQSNKTVRGEHDSGTKSSSSKQKHQTANARRAREQAAADARAAETNKSRNQNQNNNQNKN